MTKTFRDEQNTVAAPDENTRDTPKREPAAEVANKVRYGHAHARTEQLYQERRARYELKKQQEAAQAAREQQARKHEELPSVEARTSKASAQTPHAQTPHMEDSGEGPGEGTGEGFGRERVKELALDAVKSVIGAAREAVHGHPLVGARKLAGDALSGALKVAREVTSRPTSPSGGEH
ncbi:hypothetical protein CYFUS_000532 [Cystobacter fuscus]|uniref:Uncharacterized protein n=1 Tax=Cystobacter fuscus TaxID=43 RepID=A0A250IV56_9BACT|nr:hypothetical protein [Cystobacter fuscus]ATB35120.1 hypothetical protein CYFUS_000532 [Cystobacter fuscus]